MTEGTGPWVDEPGELLRVGPGFRLDSFDRRGKPGFDGKKADWKAFKPRAGKLMAELQERLFAEGRSGGERSVLCVVQGLDTAGKGGIARHVMGMVDPQGVALRSFGVPTKEEASHHFLWRIKKALPPAGRIGVFDRSHYEDVLVHRVEQLSPLDEIEKRYGEINEFEKKLVDSGTVVLKFAMMVSHDEQGLRLMERLDRPDKRWKFSESDIHTRAKWDAYQEAYQLVFERTSTDYAPWYVIPADRKWYSRAAVTEILTQALIDMDPTYPQPEWDPMDMRVQLAELMSSEALQTSLEQTDDNVSSAIKEAARVRRSSLEVSLGADGPDTPAEAADAEARRAEIDSITAAWRAECEHTKAQKEELVEQAKAREILENPANSDEA